MISLQGNMPAVPGVSQTGGLQLQGSGTNTQSMGVQTPSPKVSTATPAPIVSTVKDLSNQYANVNGTIYNKSSGQGYSDPASFFKDSGVSSFNNLKFDTNWKPATSTLAGLQMPGQTSSQSNSGSGLLAAGSTGAGLLGSTPQNSGSQPSQTPSNPAYTNAYTGTQNNNPTLSTLSNQAAQLSSPSQNEIDLSNQIAALKGNETQAMSDTSTVGDLEGATGRQTAISASANAKIQAMEEQLTNYQNQRTSALQGINDQIKTLTPVSAGSGTTLINPATGATVASTNQEVTNIAGAPTSFNPSTGLIGQGATGGGLLGSSASGGNDVASAVSSVLTSLGANDQASNSSITSAVQQAMANGGNPPSNLTAQQAQVVQQVLSKMNPSYSSNQAAGVGAAMESNAQVAGTAAVNAAAAAYPQYYKDYLDTQGAANSVDQFGSLLTSGMIDAKGNTINPSSSQYANILLSAFRNQLSSSQQGQFDTTYAALKSKLSGLLAVGGSETPTQLTSDVNSILSGNVPLGTLTDVLARIKQEGQIVENVAAQKGNQALQQAQGQNNNSSSAPAGFGWTGN